MENYNGLPRARPSNLEVLCHGCMRGILYDPTNYSQLCSDCRGQIRAPGDYGAMGLAFPRMDQTSFGPSNSPYWQHSNTRAQDQYLNSAAPMNSYSPSSSLLMRRSVIGPATQVNHDVDMSAEDDEDDEFEDAQEELPAYIDEDDMEEAYGEEIKEDIEGSEDMQVSEGDEDEDMETSPIEPNREVVDDTKNDWAANEEPDLFETVFGSHSSQANDADDEEEEEDEVVEIGELTSSKGKKASTDKKSRNGEYVKSEHTTGCKTARGPSTPPDTPRAGTPAPPCPPDPINDLSPNLKKHRPFHERAKELIPRLPLAEHRYWIGVLNVGIKAKSFSQEKHFTWMKGNRLTTVATVWHTYQTTTATEKFVLLLGHERVDFKDRMEELDYFNDRKIMFRAVREDHPDAKGRELCEFVFKKEREREGGRFVKGESVEVVEID